VVRRVDAYAENTELCGGCLGSVLMLLFDVLLRIVDIQFCWHFVLSVNEQCAVK